MEDFNPFRTKRGGVYFELAHELAIHFPIQLILYIVHIHIYLISTNTAIVIDKVEKIQEDILDSIPSPSPSVKIQIIGGKVYLR